MILTDNETMMVKSIIDELSNNNELTGLSLNLTDNRYIMLGIQINDFAEVATITISKTKPITPPTPLETKL